MTMSMLSHPSHDEPSTASEEDTILNLSIEEIERACDESRVLDFTRHESEAPDLLLRRMFYPLGFPTELRTNSAEVMLQAGELWSKFEKRFDTAPIRVDVHVVDGTLDGSGDQCPPTPGHRFMLPLLVIIADQDNYSIANFEQTITQITISRATARHKNYLQYFFLHGAPMCHIATRYATPVHAGCVSLDGRGLLLCGDSGAGKSSLSYACARAGWTYTTDDATFLLSEESQAGESRLVTGNCHQVRFRPSAAELFPEVEGLDLTPRAAGKPSIELLTAPMKNIACAQTARVDYLVFLNRRAPGPPELRRYRTDVARYFLRQVLYGSAESLAVQYEALERLLAAEIFELRYTDLNWAVDRLEMLAREGR
jgi:hypothetical protein